MGVSCKSQACRCRTCFGASRGGCRRAAPPPPRYRQGVLRGFSYGRPVAARPGTSSLPCEPQVQQQIEDVTARIQDFKDSDECARLAAAKLELLGRRTKLQMELTEARAARQKEARQALQLQEQHLLRSARAKEEERGAVEAAMRREEEQHRQREQWWGRCTGNLLVALADPDLPDAERHQLMEEQLEHMETQRREREAHDASWAAYETRLEGLRLEPDEMRVLRGLTALQRARTRRPSRPTPGGSEAPDGAPGEAALPGGPAPPAQDESCPSPPSIASGVFGAVVNGHCGAVGSMWTSCRVRTKRS